MFNGKNLSLTLKGHNKEIVQPLRMVYQMPDVALNPQQQIRRITGRPLEFCFKWVPEINPDWLDNLLDSRETRDLKFFKRKSEPLA